MFLLHLQVLGGHKTKRPSVPLSTQGQTDHTSADLRVFFWVHRTEEEN